MKVTSLLCLLCVGCVLCDTGDTGARKAAKGVFVSCRGCRLNSMPEVKRFFLDSVLKGEYGDTLTVNFTPGASPVLVLYDSKDAEIDRISVDYKTFDEMHELVQKHGFVKVLTDDTTAPAAEAAAAAAAGAKAEEPKRAAKGVFVSCRGCRLKRMPEVKRFFLDSVLKGEYGEKLTVNFTPGASPVLVLYDNDGAEIERIPVDYKSFDEMHELVQKHGFEKVPGAETPTESGAAATAEPQQAAAAADVGAMAAETATGDAQDVKKAARGQFVSCRGCRLKRMPEVKRFFLDSVLKGEYGEKLTVNFMRGASPVLVLYDDKDAEIARIPVDYMKFDELHALVQKHGFTKVPQADMSEGSAASASAAAAAAAEASLPSIPTDAATEGLTAEL